MDRIRETGAFIPDLVDYIGILPRGRSSRPKDGGPLTRGNMSRGNQDEECHHSPAVRG